MLFSDIPIKGTNLLVSAPMHPLFDLFYESTPEDIVGMLSKRFKIEHSCIEGANKFLPVHKACSAMLMHLAMVCLAKSYYETYTNLLNIHLSWIAPSKSVNWEWPITEAIITTSSYIASVYLSPSVEGDPCIRIKLRPSPAKVESVDGFHRSSIAEHAKAFKFNVREINGGGLELYPMFLSGYLNE